MTRACWNRLVAIVAVLGVAPLAVARAQECFPFGPGERLSYAVRAATLGAKGKATMSVAGPELVRGRVALVLRSEASVGVLSLRGTDRSASWIDPMRFASLRFVQVELNVLSRASDSVEIMPEEQKWFRSNGRTGDTMSDTPLDVLSFIYFLRTLPFDRDTAWSFDRHFDAARNPALVRFAGRDTVTTPAGRFPVISVEMRVNDKEHYGGDGVIHLLLSDDARRTPVRIQSVMPTAGTTVFTLTAQANSTGGPCPLVAAPLIATPERNSRPESLKEEHNR